MSESAAFPAGLGPLRRIAVFRALQIGDLLVTVPALRALRHAYPSAHITLIGLPWARDFVRRFHAYCDELLEFPGYPGLPERQPDEQALPAFFAAAHERKFDLALQMHGSGALTNPLVQALGARHSFGYRPAEVPEPAHYPVWRNGESELRRYLRLLTAMGVPSQGSALEFPIHPHEAQEAAALLRRHLPLSADPYICVHAGARLPSRRWPAERFAAVADALASRGYTVVLTGTQAEADIATQVQRAMQRHALNLVSLTSLGALAALLRDARLLLCNDTSVSHIASGTGTPSVVISSGAEVERWRPIDSRRHPVLWHDVPCRPCDHLICPTAHECAIGVSVDTVIDKACHLLGVHHMSMATVPQVAQPRDARFPMAVFQE